IMPSLWEGLPLLPMEAMALGVPVVATRSPGTAEVIDDGRTGVLVASGDECALTQQVRGLLGDEQRWRTLQANGLQRVGEAFGQVRCLSEYEALYERVLGSPAR
ncbi:glycosyl transferase family 1, partial [Rubrivivax gelatinosus]|nr:glycosyl transferase family 1 [Rubrivivax gelatinosus]